MSYQIPANMKKHLDGVFPLMQKGTNVSSEFVYNGNTLLKFNYANKLPDGTIFIDVKDFDLDTDGPSTLHEEATHQNQTTIDPQGKWCDSNKVPYFVLPPQVAAKYGIQIGDVAILLGNGNMCAAIFADIGPHAKIGEISIEAMRRLGEERVKGNRILDASLGHQGVMVIFPSQFVTTSGKSVSEILQGIHDKAVTQFVSIGGVV